MLAEYAILNFSVFDWSENFLEQKTGEITKIFLQKKSARDLKISSNFFERLKKLTSYGQAIISLMTNYFFLREQSENINDVCRIAGQLAGDDEQSKIEIANSLLIREDRGGTLIADYHMVLLHCKSKFVKSATFGILQLGEGFQYPEDGEIIRTAMILLVPFDADEYTVDTIGYISSVLLSREDFAEILHDGDEKEIQNAMLKIFEEFFMKKQNELMAEK